MVTSSDLPSYITNISPFDSVKHKIMYEFYQNDDFRQQAIKSKWVMEIGAEQKPDGSWGRFHTQNSSLKQKYPTTENALIRLNYLAMRRGDTVVDKACVYMEALLNDLSSWPDAWEGNKWFKPGVPLFIASKLAMFGSECGIYLETCGKWLDVLVKSFENDEYCSKRTNKISEQLFGVDIHDNYVQRKFTDICILCCCFLHLTVLLKNLRMKSSG